MAQAVARLLKVSAIGFALAFIAKDFSVPLFMLALMGLFDRLVGEPVFRGRQNPLT